MVNVEGDFNAIYAILNEYDEGTVRRFEIVLQNSSTARPNKHLETTTAPATPKVLHESTRNQLAFMAIFKYHIIF